MAHRFDKARVVVLLALAAGSSKRAAAGKAGISYRTLNRWQLEEEFGDAIEIATGQGRDVYETILREAAAKDWRAALAAYEVVYGTPTKARGVVDESVPIRHPTPSTSARNRRRSGSPRS